MLTAPSRSLFGPRRPQGRAGGPVHGQSLWEDRAVASNLGPDGFLMAAACGCEALKCVLRMLKALASLEVEIDIQFFCLNLEVEIMESE